jgi:hypothetical protein
VTEIHLRFHEIGPRTLLTIRTDAVTEIPLRFCTVRSMPASVRIMIDTRVVNEAVLESVTD